MKKLLILLLAVGCGGSATVNSSAVSNTNVNVDSQNGDTQCSYRCEPIEFDGGAGYLVTEECDGNQSGPEFSPRCEPISLNPAVAQESPASNFTPVDNTSLDNGVL